MQINIGIRYLPDVKLHRGCNTKTNQLNMFGKIIVCNSEVNSKQKLCGQNPDFRNVKAVGT
jgi:hypothetical protein